MHPNGRHSVVECREIIDLAKRVSEQCEQSSKDDSPPHRRLGKERVDDDEVVRRLSGRRTCRSCGHIWHLDFDPPSVEGVCDICGGELFQRDDDKPETIRHRLEVYYEQTAPLVSYYAEEGLLVGIDAMGPVDDVTDRAISSLRPFGK